MRVRNRLTSIVSVFNVPQSSGQGKIVLIKQQKAHCRETAAKMEIPGLEKRVSLSVIEFCTPNGQHQFSCADENEEFAKKMYGLFLL